KPDGTGDYTLPTIHDKKTGIYMANTIPIAQYLDMTYSSTPAVIPSGTETLVNEIIDTNFPKLNLLFMFIRIKINPASGGYIERTHSVFFGGSLKDLIPTGEAKVQTLEQLKNSFGDIGELYKKSGRRLIMGDN
ncbi:hypothetical protein BDQ17DRAFT_1258528, partial [Cyathus striatus]